MTTTDNRHDCTVADSGLAGTTDASLDTIFTTLADRRCRAVVRHLVGMDARSVGFEDLARALATDPDGPAEVERAETLLHHSLLPRLGDAGFVEHDTECGVVHYTSDADLETALDAVQRFADGDPPVALDTLLELLADDSRRCALRTLLVHEELTLPDLADEVTVEREERPLTQIDPQTVLQTYLSLYHTHVPRLTDAGLAVYDQEHDLVAATELGLALTDPIRTLCEG
ncbi:DUF7344 domain-containing protein [Halorussus halophilus]|uniref:DUF7344 domain-containing protein n=1 Tax=Halorussus halophilus TaxID=2650975 RepID=UPI00130194B2|nr:hypothetical protein [Halorussus halophilus]